jgi:hypothetical protein
MLVIPDKRKSLLLTFIHHHKLVGQANGDIVAGKGMATVRCKRSMLLTNPAGQGLVVLLSGPPGTGKTLTAEAGMLIIT